MRTLDATKDDAPAMLAISNDAVRKTTAIRNATKVDLDDRFAWLRDRQAKGFPVLAAKTPDGTGPGYASYANWRSRDGYSYTVEHSVQVARDARHVRVGRTLLVALSAWARTSGKRMMAAGIEASNAPSMRFHERLGFHEVGWLTEVGETFGTWFDLVPLPFLLDTRPTPRHGCAACCDPFGRKWHRIGRAKRAHAADTRALGLVLYGVIAQFKRWGDPSNLACLGTRARPTNGQSVVPTELVVRTSRPSWNALCLRQPAGVLSFQGCNHHGQPCRKSACGRNGLRCLARRQPFDAQIPLCWPSDRGCGFGGQGWLIWSVWDRGFDLSLQQPPTPTVCRLRRALRLCQERPTYGGDLLRDGRPDRYAVHGAQRASHDRGST